MSLRLALASQLDLPEWEVDDAPLHAALRALGATVEQPAWDDPVVSWAAYDAVLLRTTWNYAWDRDGFVEWCWRVAGQTRLLNRPRVCEWNSHKGYLADLERAGVPIAPTIWLDRGRPADVTALVGQAGWFQGFIKPVFGQTARETLRFTANGAGLRQAQAHVDRLLPAESLMLQPYLPLVETWGEASVVYVDGEPCHGVRKIPVPGDYRVQDDFGATDQPWDPPPQVQALSRQAMAAAEFHLELEEPLLYGRVDWLRDDQGGWRLTELELIEPSMFFRHGPETATALAEAWLKRLRG
jgi:hypothetical protein